MVLRASRRAWYAEPSRSCNVSAAAGLKAYGKSLARTPDVCALTSVACSRSKSRSSRFASYDGARVPA